MPCAADLMGTAGRHTAAAGRSASWHGRLCPAAEMLAAAAPPEQPRLEGHDPALAAYTAVFCEHTHSGSVHWYEII